MNEQLVQHPPAGGGDQGPLFDSLGLDPGIIKGIGAMGFHRPTPIQAGAIPPILAGRDVIGCAQTGTGKTAAFVLPIMHRLLQGEHTENMRALILSPTREIAAQSIDHLRSLAKFTHLRGAAIFGGVPMDPQIRALRQGLDVVSATPGRLLDHIWSGRISFRDLQILILDEVDRMLDMGFLPDIQNILSLLPAKRQNLAFSATLPPEIRKLLNEFMKEPVMVQVGQRASAAASAAAGIRHAIYPVPRHLKTELLTELLRNEDLVSTIVFTRTKRLADRLSQTLKNRGFNVSVLHGDRSQSQRAQALEHFRQGRSQVLVATDIAARGLDIRDITHIINYDIPYTPEDYVHRTGRTARMDAVGDAFSLMDRSEAGLIADIERALNRPLPRVTLPNFNYGRPAPAVPNRAVPHRGAPHRPGSGRPPQRHHGGGPHRSHGR